jgi:DNA-binding CsgD family transcriptional regulator
LECLQWAAGGHTSWEIGQFIGVSERTVVFHLANAAHKLGFFSRQPAIARAVALGLVTPAASVRKPPAYGKPALPR